MVYKVTIGSSAGTTLDILHVDATSVEKAAEKAIKHAKKNYTIAARVTKVEEVAEELVK